MRSLHRDIGFIVLGLTIIYSLSGIVLIYRDSDFLKSEKIIEVQLPPNLNELELSSKLRIRNLKITERTDSLYIFKTGKYNHLSGQVTYSKTSLPSFIDKFNRLHKSSSKSTVHWAATIYGVLLFFLAISSLLMFKPKSKLFKRGIVLSLTGLILAIILLFI